MRPLGTRGRNPTAIGPSSRPRLPHEKATRLVHPALILSVLSVASILAQLDVWITNVGPPAIGRGVGAALLST
jgi:hypothetical protein